MPSPASPLFRSVSAAARRASASHPLPAGHLQQEPQHAAPGARLHARDGYRRDVLQQYMRRWRHAGAMDASASHGGGAHDASRRTYHTRYSSSSGAYGSGSGSGTYGRGSSAATVGAAASSRHRTPTVLRRRHTYYERYRGLPYDRRYGTGTGTQAPASRRAVLRSRSGGDVLLPSQGSAYSSARRDLHSSRRVTFSEAAPRYYSPRHTHSHAAGSRAAAGVAWRASPGASAARLAPRWRYGDATRGATPTRAGALEATGLTPLAASPGTLSARAATGAGARTLSGSGTPYSYAAYASRSYASPARSSASSASGLEPTFTEPLAQPSATEQRRRSRMRRLHKAWHGWRYYVSVQRVERLTARRSATATLSPSASYHPSLPRASPAAGEEALTAGLRRAASEPTAALTRRRLRYDHDTAADREAERLALEVSGVRSYHYDAAHRGGTRSTARHRGHTAAAVASSKPRRRLAASHFHRMLTRRFFLAWAEATAEPHNRTRRLARRRLTLLASRTRHMRLRRRFQAWHRYAARSHATKRRVLAFMARRSLGVLRLAFDAVRGAWDDKRRLLSLYAAAQPLTRRLRLQRGIRRWRRAVARTRVVVRAVASWRHRRLHRGLRVWRAWAASHRHAHLALARAVTRWQRRREADAVATWRRWLAARKRARAGLAHALHMWRNVLLQRMFAAWVAHTAAVEERRRKLQEVRTRWLHAHLLACFERWAAFAARCRHVRTLVASALGIRRARLLVRVWAAWGGHVAARRAHKAALAAGEQHFAVTAARRGLMALLGAVARAHHRRRLLLLAVGHADTALLTRVFVRLRLGCASLRRARLRQLLAQDVARRLRLTRGLRRWLAFTDAQAGMREAAGVAFGHLRGVLVRRSWAALVAYVAHRRRRRALVEAGEHHWAMRQLRGAVGRWLAFAHARLRLSDLVTLGSAAHQRHLLARCFARMRRHGVTRRRRRATYTELTRRLMRWRAVRAVRVWRQRASSASALASRRLRVVAMLMTSARRTAFQQWRAYVALRRRKAAAVARGVRHWRRRRQRGALRRWRRWLGGARLRRNAAAAAATLNRLFRLRGAWRAWRAWQSAWRVRRLARAAVWCDRHLLARSVARLRMYVAHRHTQRAAKATAQRHFLFRSRLRAVRRWRGVVEAHASFRVRTMRAVRLWTMMCEGRAFRTLAAHAVHCRQVKRRAAMLLARSHEALVARCFEHLKA